MRIETNGVVMVLLMTMAISAAAGVKAQETSSGTMPAVFLLDAKQLQVNRRRIHDGDRTVSAAWAKLEGDAQKAMSSGPFSVVRKGATAPSGDKHDYLSQAPYYWPNPKTANGLPYVSRDGERNPEINQITDHHSLDQLESSVETLALAYYFKGDEAYAAKAVLLLRAFFLDSATRMNPNLQYAQFIPGVNTGRGIGLIETRGLTSVVDAIGLLAGSKALTENDRRGLQGWFGKFLQWMLESKNGHDEAAAKNNHGSYYDVQVASFALFVGKRELAVQVLQDAREKRIAAQVEPDGRQPLELARTKAWSYSLMNLDGLMSLATLGERTGVDLWNFQTSDGRGVRKALEFLMPAALGEQKWQYPEIGGVKPETLFPLMRRAAAVYRDKQYQGLMAKLPDLGPVDRGRLFRADPNPTKPGLR
ncbi:MAG TPA: alginate lyase family protein [Candidatus Acidoferrum sp.]|nr:alginate lyase family protein [Candidatus Acidoferrum sp.]